MNLCAIPNNFLNNYCLSVLPNISSKTVLVYQRNLINLYYWINWILKTLLFWHDLKYCKCKYMKKLSTKLVLNFNAIFISLICDQCLWKNCSRSWILCLTLSCDWQTQKWINAKIQENRQTNLFQHFFQHWCYTNTIPFSTTEKFLWY